MELVREKSKWATPAAGLHRGGEMCNSHRSHEVTTFLSSASGHESGGWLTRRALASGWWQQIRITLSVIALRGPGKARTERCDVWRDGFSAACCASGRVQLDSEARPSPLPFTVERDQ